MPELLTGFRAEIDWLLSAGGWIWLTKFYDYDQSDEACRPIFQSRHAH